MWIRSQNKKSLTKVINVTLDIPLNSGEVGIKGYFDNNKFDMLGYYKNEERAIEVLDEIQEFIMMSKTTQLTMIYEMPEK